MLRFRSAVAIPSSFECLQETGDGMKRICVFGAGGVGGYLTARLVQAGRDVTLIARGAHLDRIRSHGLTIRTKTDEFTVDVPASDMMAGFPAFDTIIITAKAPALPAIAKSLAPHLVPSTTVLFATNGVQWFYGDQFVPNGLSLDTSRLDPEGALHQLIGSERSFGVVVRSSNVVIEPGVVFNSGGGAYFVGEAVSGGTQWRDALVALLNVEGAQFTGTADIRREMWGKLVRNTAVALLCGLTHSSPGAAFSDPDMAPLALALMNEVVSVAAAHGFTDLMDVTAEAATVARMTAMKPSIVQDLELGRMVELDAQVLVVLDFARQAGVPMPVLSTLAPLLLQKARIAGCYS